MVVYEDIPDMTTRPGYNPEERKEVRLELTPLQLDQIELYIHPRIKLDQVIDGLIKLKRTITNP